MTERNHPAGCIVVDVPDRSRFLAFPSHDAWSDWNDPSARGRHLRLASKLVQTLLQHDLPWVIAREHAGRRETVALCTYGRGTLNSSLYVSLVGDVANAEPLAPALERIAARLHVTNLVAELYASAPDAASLPAFSGDSERYVNVKLYVWDLSGEDWDRRMSTNHRRNIARARKSGVRVADLPSAEALAAHLHLTGSSLNRRALRGESTALASREPEIRQLLATGRAELFQAAVDGQVLSSKVIYTTDRFAYYYSGGTSENGMRLGASHFLMHAIATSLRDRGVVSLNLDVANAGTGGLARYKADFGTEEWYVSRARCRSRDLSRLASNAWRHALAWLGNGR